jgi:hypothetical protein
LLLNLRHTFHLDVELGIDVVEMGHHHVEHVIFVQRTREAFRPSGASLADLSAAPNGSRPPARPLRPPGAGVPALPCGPIAPRDPLGPSGPRVR